MPKLLYTVTVKLCSELDTSTNPNRKDAFWEGVIAGRPLYAFEKGPLSPQTLENMARAEMPGRFSTQVRIHYESITRQIIDRQIVDFHRSTDDGREETPAESRREDEFRAAIALNRLQLANSSAEIRRLVAEQAAWQLLVLRFGEMSGGSLEVPVEIFNYEPLAKLLNNDIAGFEAFFEMLLWEAWSSELRLKKGEISVRCEASKANDFAVSVPAPPNIEETPPQDERRAEAQAASWWQRLKSATAFPITLAIIVGAYSVYAFNNVDASRREWTKTVLEYKKDELKEDRERTTKLLAEYCELVRATRSLDEAKPRNKTASESPK